MAFNKGSGGGGAANAAKIIQQHKCRKQGYSDNYTLENFNGWSL